jgi:hypothetical protein
MGRADERTLLGQLEALECSDEERLVVLARALVLRARRCRARAVRALARGGLRGAGVGALALADAEEACEVAGRCVRALRGG